MTRERTCPNCGKLFMPWRAKRYCSERCRKADENRRLRGVEKMQQNQTLNISAEAREARIPDSQKTPKIIEQNQGVMEPVRGDDTPRLERTAVWTACNEITHKLAKPGGDAIAWAIYVDRQRAWFGRVGGEMSFGPTSLPRARRAVEAYLKREPFDKLEGESSWRGDCMRLI